MPFIAPETDEAVFTGPDSDELIQPADNPSMLGSATRSLARTALPAWVGGLTGGAASGAAAGLELGPIGVIGGGLIGGALGMWGTSKAQQSVANAINPSSANPFSTASEEADVKTNPWSSELGGLMFFKPNPAKLANVLRNTATEEGRKLITEGYGIQKALAEIPKSVPSNLAGEEASNWIRNEGNNLISQNPQAFQAFHDVAGVGGNVGIGAGMGAVQGQDLPGILKGAAGGALFNEGWFHPAPHPLDATISANAEAGNPETAKALETLKAQHVAEATETPPVAPEAVKPEEVPITAPETPEPVSEPPTLQPDAVRQQVADESLLRPEEVQPEQQLELPRVDEGNAEPEVAPERSVEAPLGENEGNGEIAPETAPEASGELQAIPEQPEVQNAPESTPEGENIPLAGEPETQPETKGNLPPAQRTAEDMKLPAFDREKGGVHERQIERAIYNNEPFHAGEAERYGIEMPKGYEVGDDGIARPTEPTSKEDRIAASSSPIGQPAKDVQESHVSRAVAKLKQTALGNKLLRTSIISPDWERTLVEAKKLGREFTGQEINVIKGAQGFYDPVTGKTFVIRDNIRLHEEETPEQAVGRVMMHERVGHDGMAYMRAHDPEFEKVYTKLIPEIPKEELDSIAAQYGYDPIQDRDRLIGEWFARNVERLKPDELPNPKGVFGKMWQAIKDWIGRTFGRERATDQMVRDLASSILHHDMALEPRSGEGAVEPKASIPETPKEESKIELSLATVAKSVGDFAKDAKDMLEEGMKVRPFTDFRKTINKFGAHLMESVLRGRQFQKEFRGAVPKKATREAIGAYMEAGGDLSQLKAWEAASKGRDAERYKEAQNLSPDQIKWADQMKDMYDDLAQKAVASGILDAQSIKKNYLTKVWDLPTNPSKRKAFDQFATKFSQNFQFGKKSTFNNFFEGIQAGFKPKTLDPSELLPIYMTEMGKTIGTRDMIRDLTKLKASDGNPLAVPIGGTVDTGPKSPTDPSLVTARTPNVDEESYRRINNAALSKWKWVGKDAGGNDVLYKGELAVHPEIYQHMKNILGRSAIREWYESPSTNLGSALAKKAVSIADTLNSAVKQSMLSFSPFHIVQEATHAVGHKVSPFSFEHVNPDNPAHLDAMRHGLMLAGDNTGMDQWMEGAAGGGIMNKVPGLGKLNQKIADFTFHEYIPGLKLKTYEAALKRNMERFKDDISSGKMSEGDVKGLTADQVNNAYGHLNYKDMGSNPTLQHILRLTLLAPDFLRARLGFTKQAIQGLASKTGREQLNAMAVLAGTFYVGARILNGLINDGDTKAKESPFGVVIGDRVYTMRSVPEDIYKALTEPRRFVSGRLSPLTTRTAMEALTGKDYRGQNISSEQVAMNALMQAVPLSAKELPWVRNITQTSSQNPVSPWEQFMSTLGVHVNRWSPISQTYKNLAEWNKKTGKPDEGTYPVSKYAQMRYALEDNDPQKAKEEWDKLVEHEQAQNPKLSASKLKDKLTSGFHQSIMKGFAHTSQDEQDFYKSLDGDQKAQFNEATKMKSRIWRRFTLASGRGQEMDRVPRNRLAQN